MMLRIALLSLLTVWALTRIQAQSATFYPTHWFTGMKWNKVQVMVHEPGIGRYSSVVTSMPGVKVASSTKTEHPDYYVVNLVISPAAKPGTVNLTFKGSGLAAKNLRFPLKARRAGNGTQFAQGVTSKDLVYLIMPDRFANGDPTNDRIAGYKDTICDRQNPSAHHGGDIKGVMNHLPYLQELGVTSVWMCPVTENDMPWKQEPAGAISGYHGYWITNHYQIDKRYGGNDAYKQLTNAAHARGMKVIQDAVYNHIGDEHFIYKDAPFKDMINRWPTYTGSNHREETFYSPYISAADKKVMIEGWFTPHLPDLNLRNPYTANFIIQNTIWCTEEFGVDAWRVDTYKYCDEQFLNNINNALLAEYPKLTVFGEAWCNSVPGSAYFVRNNMKVPFKHNLLGTTDFPMQGAMLAAITEDYGWTNGANKLMGILAQDALYEDPSRNCIFLDNHDMDRFMTMINGDLNKYKMGIALLLTMRGIPQIYYGTEIGMVNDNVQGDGKKRNDFPGGFAGDTQNKFTAAGRSAQENELYDYVKALANFRKSSPALTIGSTHDFLPTNGGVYVYARKHGTQTVLCILNTAKTEKEVDMQPYQSVTEGFTKGLDVVNKTSYPLQNSLTIPAQTLRVLSLQ